MFAPINCLMWTGDTINDDLRNLLYNTAQDMLAKKINISTLNEDWCEGSVTTNFSVSGIGGTFGYKFNASVDWHDKHTKIEFIIKESNIRYNGVSWTEVTPEEIFSNPDVDPKLN